MQRKYIVFIVIALSIMYYFFPFYNKQYLPVILNNVSKSDFIVYTTGCKIMEMDPFAFEDPAKGVFKKTKPMKCRPTIAKLEDQRLVIDENLQKDWTPESSDCCYRSISRIEQDPNNYNGRADWNIKYSEICHPIPFGNQGIVVNDSYVKVECNGFGKKEPVADFFGITIPPSQLSTPTKAKANFWKARANNKLQNPPNVLIVGIDSSSRLHTIRSLPKTRQIILENDFIELKGYTKLDGNTFPNIMAGLAGMELNEISKIPNNKKMDDYQFLWKNFSELNYLTGVWEDAPSIGTFNFRKIGFVLPPSDYFLRPLNVAAHLHNGWKGATTRVACINGLNPTFFMCDLIENFITKMKNDYPYFIFSWLTSTGHDDFNGLQTADEAFYGFFSAAMNASKADPENTVIIFMSDHGYRFGKFRQTFLGYFEESLPFFFIRLPPKLKQRYPHWYRNLKINGERLVSPYDLHSTLTQILHNAKLNVLNDDASPAPTETDGAEYIFDNTVMSTPSKPQFRKKYSFFEFIPESRTCKDAGIPQRNCMCGIMPPKGSKKSLVSEKTFGELIISQVNNILESAIKSGLCAPLEYSKIVYKREVGNGKEKSGGKEHVTFQDFVVAIEAEPSKARFEAKVRHFQNSTDSILGEIARINSYEGQTDCVTDLSLQNFCYCTNIKFQGTTNIRNI